MKKKAISCLLALMSVVSLAGSVPVSVLADDDTAAAVTTQEVTEAGTQNTTVTYHQASSYTVTIPKTITLNGDKTASYEVKVKGDIAGNESVTVVPDATVVLNDSNGKNPVTGTIAQTKTEFASNDVNGVDGTVTNGTITATDLTAGSWEGQFNFAVNIGSATSDSDPDASLQAGLYDADGKMLVSWEDSGIDISKDYAYGNYSTAATSGYYVLTNIYPTTTKVIIPNNTISIGGYAFNGCSSLESITIPDSVTSIGNMAFGNCSGLTSITIPDNVTSIDNSAFSNCSNLASINIPDSVTSINVSVFYGCRNLTSIAIPDNITNIQSQAFKYCSGLTNVTYKGNSYTSKSALTNILTNNNVTVAAYAFSDTGLTD